MKGFIPVPFVGLGLVFCVLLTGCGGSAPHNGAAPLYVSNQSMPQGVQADNYNQQLFANGGQSPYTWSLDSGSLPPGLTLDPSGLVHGTATTPGDSAFTVRVTDSQSPTKAYNTAYLSITINPPLSLPPTTLPNGVINVAYNQTVAAAGGLKPYLYAIAPGSGPLPPGLTLDTIKGIISGTPTGPTGTYNFSLQVTDAASDVATGNFSITVTGKLQGSYAFSFNGFNNGQPFYMAGSFIADGNGNILSGVIDRNGSDTVGVALNSAISPGTGGTGNCPVPSAATGSVYCVAYNNLGNLIMVTAQGTYNFQIALSLVADGRLILADPSNPAVYGSGVFKKQAAAGTTLTNLTFAYGFFGIDGAGKRYAGAGTFATDASGNITNTCCGPAMADLNDAGIPSAQVTLSGNISAIDPATGRGTAVMTYPGGTQNYVIYGGIGSRQGEVIALETDNFVSGSPVTLASILAQTASGGTGGQFGNQSLNANGTNPAASSVVFEWNALSGSAPDVVLGQATFTPSSGTVASYSFDENNAGSVTQTSYASATYSVAKNGRATFTGIGASAPIWYLVGANTGFTIGTDAGVTYGTFEPQTILPPYNNLAIFGNFYGGTVNPLTSSVTNEADSVQVLPPNSTWTGFEATSGPGGVQINQPVSDTYCISDPNNPNGCLAPPGTNNSGRILVQNAGVTVDILYIVSGGAGGITNANTRVVMMTTDQNPHLDALLH